MKLQALEIDPICCLFPRVFSTYSEITEILTLGLLILTLDQVPAERTETVGPFSVFPVMRTPFIVIFLLFELHSFF